VIDLTDPEERLSELSALVASLPFPNYCLLRALSAHLIRIVQNAPINKMTVRNVGIVFSPTLSIPAGVFNLMLSEFQRVFGVEEENEPEREDQQNGVELPVEVDPQGEATPRIRRPVSDSQQTHRNSVGYAEGSADRLLGLTGRSLSSKLF